jgi:hypothetical protein
MSLTPAIREAYASCPVTMAELSTIEINHPTWSSPVRLVRDRIDLVATIETGPTVTFLAYPFDFSLPKKGEGRQELTITIDNAGRLLMDAIEALDLSVDQPVSVTYRAYLSTDLTRPGQRINLSARTLSIDTQRVTLTCGYADFLNRKFPRRVYRVEDFPGLASRV